MIGNILAVALVFFIGYFILFNIPDMIKEYREIKRMINELGKKMEDYKDIINGLNDK